MTFKSWRSYSNFRYSVSTKSRYIQSNDSIEFLNSIIDTAEKHERSLEAGTVVWRAQNGHSLRPLYQYDSETDQEIHIDDFPVPFPDSRMKPLTESATEGRANSKGIPSLYVATTKDTAMAEVRPWLGAVLSVGKFELKKDLKIIDFTQAQIESRILWYVDEPTEEKRVEAVWSELNKAFSTPTRTSDLTSEYAPTQIISEFIKSKGYDGIAYKSSLSDGQNICLFDLSSADIVDSYIYHAKEINFKFEIENSPWED